MASIRQLRFTTGIDGSGFDTGISRLTSQADAISKGIGDKLDMKASLGMAGDGGGGAIKQVEDSVGGMAAAFVPLGAMIANGLKSALAPIAGIVGGSAKVISKQLNDSFNFAKVQDSIHSTKAIFENDIRRMTQAAANFSTSANAGNAAMFGQLKARIADADRQYQAFLNHSSANLVKGGTLPGIDTLFTKKSKSFNPGKSIDVGKMDQGRAAMMGIGRATDRATQSMKGFGLEVVAALGFFALGYKAVGFLKEGVSNAMSLGETVSKVATVFGNETGTINAQVDEMTRKFGLVKGPLLDAEASFGLMGKAAGLSQAGVAGLATKMTGLSADIMSFYNIPFEEAQAKLRAGLAGQSEPLRALGVFMDEDTTAAQALRMGLAATKDELTEGMKIQARAALIANGLGDATGDLERTQGSAANQFRKFTGSITNVGSAIGQLLLPALTTGIGLLNDFGTFAMKTFEDNKATLEGWGAKLTSVFEGVGIAFRNWGELFEIARLKVIQGVINITEHFATLGPNVILIAKYIGDNWYKLISDGFNASLAIVKNFGSNIAALGEAIGTFLADPTRGFEVKWTGLLEGFEATAAKLPELIKPHLTDMSKEINEAWGRIDANEAKRAAALAPNAAAAVKRGVLDPNAIDPEKDKKKKGNKPDERKFAGASEMGSAEAYSTIIRGMGGRGGGDKTQADQLAVQRRMAAALDKINGGIGQIAGMKPQEPMGMFA
jgi:hypothetical protein